MNPQVIRVGAVAVGVGFGAVMQVVHNMVRTGGGMLPAQS